MSNTYYTEQCTTSVHYITVFPSHTLLLYNQFVGVPSWLRALISAYFFLHSHLWTMLNGLARVHVTIFSLMPIHQNIVKGAVVSRYVHVDIERTL